MDRQTPSRMPWWIDPTAINGPNASPGISWDGCLPAGAEVIALYLAFALGPDAASSFPVERLCLLAAFNDGFGAVFDTRRLAFNLAPSSDGTYLLGYGGVQLNPPFHLSPQDTRIDVVLYPSGFLSDPTGGPGAYTLVRSGQTFGGDYFVKGCALLVRQVS